MFYTNRRSSVNPDRSPECLDSSLLTFQARLLITEELLHTIGGAAALTLGVGITAFAVGGRRSRMLELELSGDPEKVRSIVQGDPKQVARLRRQLRIDYAFIAAYWLTFVGMSIAVARLGGAFYDVLGLFAALAATATALLDAIENVRTSGVLALTRPTDQVRRQPVLHLRQTSLAKWGASAVTLALLAVLFLGGEGWLVWLGIGFVGVAVLGLLAVRWSGLVTAYFLGFCLLGAIVAGTFVVFADEVLERL